MPTPVSNPRLVMLKGRSRHRGGALLWTVAMLSVLSVTLAAATTTFYQLARLSRRNRERLAASQVGQRELERARGGAYHAVTRRATPVAGLSGGQTVVAVTPDRDPALRQVRVEVSWRDPDGERRMQWTTLVAR
jgi:hypothetical protein